MSNVTSVFQGIPGAHSPLVLKAYFKAMGLDSKPEGVSTLREVARAVLSGQSDIGILPVDNAIAGTFREGYDLLAEYNLVPFAEMVWRMDHRLLGPEGASLNEVREILAHPIVIGECGKFLSSLYGAKITPWQDTGMAAKAVAEANDPTKVAIAPPEAAELYGLQELATNIADHPENYTRFILFRSPHASGEAAQLGANVPLKDRKTSVLLSVSNEQGQLARSLSTLSDSGINLLKLESRPVLGKPFEVVFYIDFSGDRNERRVAEAIEKLKEEAVYLQVIGSYDSFPTGNVKSQGDFSIIPQASLPQEDLASLMPASSKNWPKAVRTAQEERTHLKIGQNILGANEFFVIAGPCSVESREQVMATAGAVREYGATLLRGGAFKPRTNPYSFQGLGWEGVQLLAEAGRAHGMPIVSEVMSLDQVDRMAREVDVLQIGARNMQNYDLLKKVGQTDRIVLLKRGLSASLDEFLSAAEYILASGNPKVILCERGIRTFETSTRFTLDLSAVPVLKERTHLPIIIDPSHGVGVRRWIKPLCRAAKAVGAHGMIVEVHPNPAEAKSDKDQALTFDDFREIMQELQEIPFPDND